METTLYYCREKALNRLRKIIFYVSPKIGQYIYDNANLVNCASGTQKNNVKINEIGNVSRKYHLKS